MCRWISIICMSAALAGCQSTPPVVPTAVGVEPHALFCDHMVLQRGIEIPVWGRAQPGGVVQVELNEKTAHAFAGADGIWMARLPEMTAGGPYELMIRGQGSLTYTNVMVGDVWICSGQSNMKWPVKNCNHADEEIAAADHPGIRLFAVPCVTSEQPEYDVDGTWQVCSPETVPDFSAVAYFFGRELHRELDVPQGLIQTAWSGSPAEAWTTLETLQANPECAPILERYAAALKDYPRAFEKYKIQLANWKKADSDKVDRSRQKDSGNKGFGLGYAAPGFDDSAWQTMTLPMMWEPVMDIDGAVWFRRTVDAPADWAGQDLTLSLGIVDDFDVTYFNGVQVGATGQETPNFWESHREYAVPGSLVNPGRNVIAVRVFDHYSNGGFNSPAGQMTLAPTSGGQAVSLAGDWRFQVSIELDPDALVPAQRPKAPLGPTHSHSPARLYNAMIHPLAPYGIKGAIWYQGETNVGRACQYRKLLASMITDWRRVWGQGDFPFFTVQLANYLAAKKQPVPSAWAELREAQAMTLDTLPNTGLAVTIDIGEAQDIHPRNKQDVGRRLSLAAQALAFGGDVTGSGPRFKSMKIEGAWIRLYFDHIGGGLTAKGGPLKQFAIAGEDQKFVWADAVIEGDTIVVASDVVARPVAVRYAWADNPAGCNLCNAEGLPAIPFRTDDWKSITAGKF